MDRKPANKAATAPEDKAPEATPSEATPLYRLKTPSGVEYTTPDRREAEHLNRTRGYVFI